MPAIYFFEQQKVSWFRERRKFRDLLLELFKKEKRPVETIQFVFMSDDELLEVNRQYLQHDFYTDIITFDLSEGKLAPVVSDIYISIDRVEENAREWNSSRINELRRVMIHGCLHLCGYKDKLKADKARMRDKEDFYLRLYSKRST